jgi:hypothetical protein
MTLWELIAAAAVIIGLGVLTVVIFFPMGSKKKHQPAQGTAQENLNQAVEENILHIFDDRYREELKNRGRLQFQEIISQNTMFLQQDLRLTASELNEYVKAEISRKLQDEFAKYDQAIDDAKNIALDSIGRINAAIEEGRQILDQQIEKELSQSKQRIIKHFEANMAEIVNHYIITAVGGQIDLNSQLEFILADLEANKAAIIEDINNGA